MLCDFKATGKLDDRNRSEYLCATCGASVNSRQTDPARIYRTCDASPPTVFPPVARQVKTALRAGGFVMRQAKHGVGEILKRKIATMDGWLPIKLSDKPGCGCDEYAAELDSRGVDYCRQHVEEILDELQQRAKENGFPFLRIVARKMVSSAISEATESCPVDKWGIPRPKWITTKQLTADTIKLAALLPPNISGIVGNVRSGMIPASLLACQLHLPLWALDDSGLQQLGHGWRLKDYRPASGPLVVVDDTSMTGRSLQQIKKTMHRLHADIEYVTAVVYHGSESLVKADFQAVELPPPHFLEWNFFNSFHVKKSGFDFDGVLCADIDPHDDDDGERYLSAVANAKPLYLPRKGIVPLIATARLEKYRQPTLDWLERHNVEIDKLVMGPWSNNRERSEPGAVAKFKAATIAGTELEIFVESCPQQSREIAAITGRRVICPTTDEVF